MDHSSKAYRSSCLIHKDQMSLPFHTKRKRDRRMRYPGQSWVGCVLDFEAGTHHAVDEMDHDIVAISIWRIVWHDQKEKRGHMVNKHGYISNMADNYSILS
ncbi:hypothetical protein EYC84_001228 [Monilinia fructicola]|uniref:Uncharacterized protein n=1 Tax=Monilinia fructicola TaxID=38448 RepID=A0A5M9JNP6_MONFR|nr:hypothetical protein EYC84_001228 [Monilinia fructicola]